MLLQSLKDFAGALQTRRASDKEGLSRDSSNVAPKRNQCGQVESLIKINASARDVSDKGAIQKPVNISEGRRAKPASIVYWMRFMLAVVAGFANHILGISELGFPGFAIIAAILVGSLFYLFSIIIVQRVFNYGEAELKGKNRYITFGGGTFIVVWVMVAVVLNTPCILNNPCS